MSMQDDSPEYEGGTISRVRSTEKSFIYYIGIRIRRQHEFSGSYFYRYVQ